MNIIRATGNFEIELSPGDGILPDTGRFDFAKTWTGEAAGTSTGVMLSAGDPAAGAAGYVALERFQGHVAGRQGSVALQQFGTMSEGAPVLRYEIVPGSGSGDLAGALGSLDLAISDGVHEVTWQLRLP